MRSLAVCTVFWISLISGPALAAERAGITIRVLYDNYTHDDALQTDWGFACLISGTESTILFDTGGKGELLLSNFEKMQVKPSQVDFVVISHTHQDHIGGLLPFLGRNDRVGVYLPTDTPQQFVEQAKQKAASVTVVTEPREICRGVTVLGPLGDEVKEQALLVDTPQGTVIINGCSHPGIVQVTAASRKHTGHNISMVLGGMHLLRHTDDELGMVISELRELGVQKVAPTHCTGDKAIARFKQAFGEEFVAMGVGKVVELIRP